MNVLNFLRPHTPYAMLLALIALCLPLNAEPPNIVVILADDLGYNDTSCYGAKLFETPNIDRLSKEGMRFTDAHSSAATCAPSRYGVLTGNYPFRNKWFRKGVHKPGYPLGIDLQEMTLGSLAQKQGYTTGAFGKWHLGFGDKQLPDYNQKLIGPNELGFNETFTDITNLACNVYMHNGKALNLDPNDPLRWPQPEKPDAWQILDGGEKTRTAKKPKASKVFTEKACDFIRDNKDKPFLVYFTPHGVHLPYIVSDKFKGKSKVGIYVDYILELDWLVGKILKTLDETGLTDNTLVIFASDNGAGYYKQGQIQSLKAGHRSNGELLGQKMDIWEGGHRVPFIARWPKVIPKGKVSDQLVSLQDIAATLCDIWDVEPQQDAMTDSLSFLPTLKEGEQSARNSLAYMAINGMLALRHQEWVYIPAPGTGGHTLKVGEKGSLLTYDQISFFENSNYTQEGKLRDDAPRGQLYNLKKDLSQKFNIYNQHPEMVSRLSKLLKGLKSGKQTR